MKVKELFARKTQLREQKKSLLEQIHQLTSKMEKEDLQKFISTGDSSQVDGAGLQKLQRKEKHLTLLQGSLDREILEVSKKERAREIVKLTRQADEILAQREKIKQKVHHFRVKIADLSEKHNEMKTQERALRRDALPGNPVGEAGFRLSKMEEFFRSHAIMNSENLEEKILAGRRHNRRLLEKGNCATDDKFYQNFKLKWDVKTGKVLDFELTTQRAEMLLRARDVTKESLLKEIC